MEKKMFIVFVGILMFCCGLASAAENLVDVDGPWCSDTTWSLGHVPLATEDVGVAWGKSTYIDDCNAVFLTNCNIGYGTGANPPISTLTLNSGSLIGANLNMSLESHGSFIMNDGFTDIFQTNVGVWGTATTYGYMEMNGGHFTTDWMAICLNTGGTGHLQMNGGHLEVGAMFGMGPAGAPSVAPYPEGMNNNPWVATPSLDLSGGVLTTGWDMGPHIDYYVQHGFIAAYGGAGEVRYEVLDGYPGYALYGVTYQVWGPSPKDGATDVRVDTDLCWHSPSDDPTGDTFSYHVYYRDPDPNNWAGPFLVTGPEPHCYTPESDLTPGVEYTWRVLVIEPNEPGEPYIRPEPNVWTFTTEPVYGKADLFSPSPSGTPDVALDATLQWDAGSNAQWHNVYFSTNETLVANRDVSVRVEYMLPATTTFHDSFGADLMDVSTTYFWIVDAGAGENVVAPGDEPWNFTTEPLECLPPVSTLDQNGDCVIDLNEFLGIAANWLKCGYNNPAYCP